ncbi:MAG TPA: hypothetical protein DCP28_26660, partial [Cytophagales bacterium]|nr:hypothetical protein [Cytophagales bacterium]
MSIRVYGTLLLGILLSFSAFGQSDIKVSGNYQNKSLVEIFEDLEKRYDVSFNYANDLMASHKVTVRLRNEPIGTAIDKILATVPFRFMISSQTNILIIPDPKKNLAPPPPTLTTVSGRAT